MDTRTAAAKWIKGYRAAWKKSDAEAIVDLFTNNVSYRSHPYRPSSLGRGGVLAYTRRAFGSEKVQRVRFGRPIVDGSRAAVEYWTTMTEEGRDVTLAGCVMLRFSSDGRCSELRDYWLMKSGYIAPPESWGR